MNSIILSLIYNLYHDNYRIHFCLNDPWGYVAYIQYQLRTKFMFRSDAFKRQGTCFYCLFT